MHGAPKEFCTLIALYFGVVVRLSRLGLLLVCLQNHLVRYMAMDSLTRDKISSTTSSDNYELSEIAGRLGV
jgi:hypothetical protein